MEDTDPSAPTPDTVDEVEGEGEVAIAPRADDEITIGTSVGRYIVLSVLGKGGTGVVYAAYDPRLDRKIALKLVQPSPRGHERLLREAQAMAQLGHPNVVAVHDVGTVGDRVFVAMEMVEGGTLRAWQRETIRPWRDVLRLYLAAGSGLEAAHARGLVHRDFKPDNVLVGRDGAVRVVDFGLVIRADSRDDAVAGHTPPTLPERPAAGGARSRGPTTAPAPSSTRDHMTVVGAILGTPGYMAPEQFEATVTDARSDQFSFCAALFEGLHGHKPFEGRTIAELRASTLAGRIRAPNRSRRVPAHIQRALEKGLSRDPVRRWGSMTELLAQLRRDRGRAWRRAGIGALAIAAVAASAAWIVETRSRRAQVCAGGEVLAARAWNPELDARLRSAFEATGLAHASRAHQTISGALGRFTHDWTAMRRNACLATRVRREQSEAVMTLRLSCLDHQLDEVASFAALMARGGRDRVQRAVEAAREVPDVAACADVAALLAPQAVPADRTTRARVDELRHRLAGARALIAVGDFALARDQLQALVPDARATAYLALEAEVLLAFGRAQDDAGEYAAAAATLADAEQIADEARHDTVRGTALIIRAAVTGRWLGHYAESEGLAHRAGRIARRIGDRELEWAVLDTLARVHGYLGRLDQAVDEGRRSIALAEDLFGPDDTRIATAHGGLAVALADLGRLDEAQAEDMFVLRFNERVLGDTHPRLVNLTSNVATNLAWAGRPAEALPLAERARDLARREHGESHPQFGLTLNLVGYILNLMGRFQEALEANSQSLAIYELQGEGYVEIVYPLVGMGESLLGLGDAGRALPLLERATRLADKHELDVETMGMCHYHYGRALLLASKDRARAIEQVKKSVADFSRAPRLARQRRDAEAWLEAQGVTPAPPPAPPATAPAPPPARPAAAP